MMCQSVLLTLGFECQERWKGAEQTGRWNRCCGVPMSPVYHCPSCFVCAGLFGWHDWHHQGSLVELFEVYDSIDNDTLLPYTSMDVHLS